MADTLKTPFGQVKKEYVIVGGIALLVVGSAYYRAYKAKKAAEATAQAGATTGVDPATGYVYGTAEDAAALGNQNSYLNPSPSGGGGSSYVGTGPGTFTNNAQWTQYVEQTLTGNGAVTSDGASQLSEALGKYITGQAVTDEQHSLISQAIAIGGYPPVAGLTGYPPSINVTPSGPTSNTGGQLPAVTGLWGGSGMFNRVNGQLVNNYIDAGWNPVTGAVKYHLKEHSAYGGREWDTTETSVHETGLTAPNADHYITVWPVDNKGNQGLPATIVVHTHDNSM